MFKGSTQAQINEDAELVIDCWLDSGKTVASVGTINGWLGIGQLRILAALRYLSVQGMVRPLDPARIEWEMTD